jgi:hypothetical protein
MLGRHAEAQRIREERLSEGRARCVCASKRPGGSVAPALDDPRRRRNRDVRSDRADHAAADDDGRAARQAHAVEHVHVPEDDDVCGGLRSEGTVRRREERSSVVAVSAP